MKLVKLTLSDSAYSRLLALAGAHAVPLEAYLASGIEDFLDQNASLLWRKSPLASKLNKLKTEKINVSGQPVVFGKFLQTRPMPDTLEQVLEVCKQVYRNKAIPEDPKLAKTQFLEAINTVAKNTINSQTGSKGVNITTVRDKCTTDRRLGLPGVHIDTPTFVGWLCRPELLRDHLCRKFPEFINDIHQKFADWLPVISYQVAEATKQKKSS